MRLPTAVALVVGSTLAAGGGASGAAIQSTVFTHGEGGFVCIRAPGTLALPFDVMLSFAAARSWSGDVRTPSLPAPLLPPIPPRADGAACCGAVLLPDHGAAGQPEALLGACREALHRPRRLMYLRLSPPVFWACRH